MAGNAAALEARRVEMAQPGLLKDLHLRTVQVPAPGPSELRIRVEAVALTFRELMRALGVYPGPPGEGVLSFDGDFVGTVLDLGEGVENLRAGERVLGWGRGVLCSALTTSASAVVSLEVGPGDSHDARGVQDACALATLGAYVAPLHAMFDRGGLRAGQSVLIHAAAGGTGLAAVHYARRLGCSLLLTAGRPEKRDYLAAFQPLRIASSRDCAFEQEVAEATGGRGVDMVLNSLSGSLLQAGLACLGPRGHFLDLSRRDIELGTPVPLSLFRNNGSYTAINVQDLPPDAIGELYRRVVYDYAQGVIPCLPYEAFPLDEVSAAFVRLRRAQHIGRVIVRPLP